MSRVGTFSVRAEMPNPDHSLLPGEFTKVKVLLDVREKAVVVPSRALVVEKGGSFVYVMRRDSIVEKRFIETGPEVPNGVVAERGLAPGEYLVVEGYHKLTPGMKVNPIVGRLKPSEVEVPEEESFVADSVATRKEDATESR